MPATLSRRGSAKPKAAILDNAGISELLVLEADKMEGHLQRAYQRAARSAFLWPEEAADLIEQNRSLTELSAVGPYLEKTIKRWIDDPPDIAEVPPIRQGFLTLAQARKILREDPEWSRLYRGDLHMHSTWSDGSGSVAEMAQAGLERSYEYIAIADHSKGLKIAGGINESELEQQAAEIEQVNETIAKHSATFRVLHSLEMNLNPDGAGDMESDALVKLDLVIGSFHSALRKIEDQTERYLRGIRNPDIHILGHPRGRVYNYRIGLQADWKRVFGEAAKLDKAVEIDAYPDRQDLNVELLLIAKKSGCKISIDTDAHHPWQLAFVELGQAAALLAGIPEECIINFWPQKKLLKWADKIRGL